MDADGNPSASPLRAAAAGLLARFKPGPPAPAKSAKDAESEEAAAAAARFPKSTSRSSSTSSTPTSGGATPSAFSRGGAGAAGGAGSSGAGRRKEEEEGRPRHRVPGAKKHSASSATGSAGGAAGVGADRAGDEELLRTVSGASTDSSKGRGRHAAVHGEAGEEGRAGRVRGSGLVEHAEGMEGAHDVSLVAVVDFH
ncbi:unnamed protein product [Closterium sp. NIES-54]